MERISCQSQLVLDARRRYVAREAPFSRPGPFQGCMKRKNCHGKASENASHENIATDGHPGTHHGEISPPADVGGRNGQAQDGAASGETGHAGADRYHWRGRAPARAGRSGFQALRWVWSCQGAGAAGPKRRVRHGAVPLHYRPPKTKEGERFARLLSLFSFTTRVARDLRSDKPPTFGIPFCWEFRVRRNCASRPIRRWQVSAQISLRTLTRLSSRADC